MPAINHDPDDRRTASRIGTRNADQYAMLQISSQRGRITPTCTIIGDRILGSWFSTTIVQVLAAINASIHADLPEYCQALPPRGRNRDVVAIDTTVKETFKLVDGYSLTVSLTVHYAAAGLTEEALNRAARYLTQGTIRSTLPLLLQLDPDLEVVHRQTIEDAIDDRGRLPRFRLRAAPAAA